MLIIFCNLNMSVDMALCGGFFPQSDRLFEITASLLEDGKPLHCQSEIGFRYVKFESMLEETRRRFPVTEILEQLAEGDEIESVLHASLIRICYHLVHVSKQRRHGDHIHGVVIENACQRA